MNIVCTHRHNPIELVHLRSGGPWFLDTAALYLTTRRLRETKKETGLSQSQLACSIGTPVKSLQNWEAERYQPRLEALPKLARSLGVSLDVLLVDGDGDAAAAKSAPARRKKGGK